MKEYLRKLYIVVTGVVLLSVLLLPFHGEETTGTFDWIIHNISYPSLVMFIAAAWFGGYRKFDDIMEKWLNK